MWVRCSGPFPVSSQAGGRGSWIRANKMGLMGGGGGEQVTVTTVIVGMIQTGAQAAAEGGLDLNAPNVFGSADAYA